MTVLEPTGSTDPDIAHAPSPVVAIAEKLYADLAPTRADAEHPLDTLARLVDGETTAAVLRWLAGARRASPATRRSYLDDTNRWAAYVLAAGVATRPVSLLRVMTRDVVTGWCVWATTEQASARGPLAPRTRARRLSSLSSLFKHAAKTDPSICNPVDGEDHVPAADRVESGTRPRGATRVLSPAEVAGMRAACGSGLDQAVLGLLYEPALRVTEVVGAQVEDLEWGEEVALLVRRKGGKFVRKQLTTRTADALRAYLGDRAEGPLLLDGRGAPLDRFDVVRIMRRLARRGGVSDPNRVTPHVMRATAITALLDQGTPVQEVQAFAGHADPKTTTGYWERRNGVTRDRVLSERLARQLDEIDAGL